MDGAPPAASLPGRGPARAPSRHRRPAPGHHKHRDALREKTVPVRWSAEASASDDRGGKVTQEVVRAVAVR
ncbi:hypothetical protein ACFZDK_06020 [Streptomyces sp. NPDC007901]|uniref:hypothetical protein n=1 Tax=Streptomyces sp. NPDC007901 TaxID=3364785 RepID=UPI0036F03341